MVYFSTCQEKSYVKIISCIMSLQLCLKNYCMKRNGVSFLHFHAGEQELISSQCYAHYRVNKYLMFLMINMIKIINPGILSSNIYYIII